MSLVERMLELNKRRGGSRTAQGALQRGRTVAGGDTGPTELEREIAATDEEIDELVYQLYGITDEERKIIDSP